MAKNIKGFFSISGNGRLVITATEVLNLIGLPPELPEIRFLDIKGRRIENLDQTPVLMNFRSFKGLPDIMPRLESISIYDSNIQNIETLTTKIPFLQIFHFKNCHITNLKGIPKAKNFVSFVNCTIDSFEGLEINNLDILDNSKQHAFLYDTSFSSLHGINRTTLQSILIEYFSRFRDFYSPTNLTPKGLELLNNCINREVYIANSPLEYIRARLARIAPSGYFEEQGRTFDSEIKHNIDGLDIDGFIGVLNERGFNYHSNREWNDSKDPYGVGMEFWVYARGLEEQLFIPEKIDELLRFYKKSPADLALHYRSNPKSLSSDQIDRLIHEANHQILQILEDDEFSTLQKDDAVISQISQRFAINTENGKVFL